MKKSNEFKIKSCPYCGGRAYIAENLNNLYIDCEHTNECKLTPNTWLISSQSLEEQIRSWNLRYKESKDEKWFQRRLYNKRKEDEDE
ncbi:MAG: hypothetical protein ACI4PE_02770 [Bacilli bacterium]